MAEILDPNVSQFLGTLQVEHLEKGRKRLLWPLPFYSAHPKFKGILVAPAGTITDFASTPRIVWMIYPKDGPWSAAAVMHDAGYQKNLVTQHGQPIHLTKQLCDDLFEEALRVSPEVTDRARRFMSFAVRKFGKGVPGLAGRPR